MAEIVSTSVYRYLLGRMAQVHRQGSIGAFAGPPGLGKTTAARRFIADHPSAAVLVTVRLPGAKTVLVLQEVLAAIRSAAGYAYHSQPSGKRELLGALRNAVEEWGWRLGLGEACAMSLVFDEAQNLSPESIEALRFWNDATGAEDRPLGLIFLGNDQFHLDETEKHPSFLSAAVRSRTPYLKTFNYRDLTDDDLTLVIEATGAFEPDATALMLRHCLARPFHRDLRELSRDLEALADEAAGAPITATIVRTVLGMD